MFQGQTSGWMSQGVQVTQSGKSSDRRQISSGTTAPLTIRIPAIQARHRSGTEYRIARFAPSACLARPMLSVNHSLGDSWGLLPSEIEAISNDDLG